MCSWYVDPIMVLEALKKGADNVLIACCHLVIVIINLVTIKQIRRIKILKKHLSSG